jgi:hypothetical protein
MSNKSVRVNLTEAQIKVLLFAAGGGDISTLHPTRARSLGYALKALRKAAALRPGVAHRGGEPCLN